MHSINRQIAVIKPKKPCIDWINSLPESDEPYDDESLQKDCTVFLLPHLDDDEESLKYIESIYSKIFKIELDSWYTDPAFWPKNRTFSLFMKWFEIEFHSEVLDTLEARIVKKEY
jgi:hypothetical protein